MTIDPPISYTLRADGRPGMFCFVPGGDGGIVYGLLIEPAQQSRPFDFLGLQSFTVSELPAGSGVDFVFALPSAYIRIADPFSGNIRTCRPGDMPSIGSIVLRPEGPAIVGVAGENYVVVDIKTGKFLHNNFHRAILATSWQVACPALGGGYKVVMQYE